MILEADVCIALLEARLAVRAGDVDETYRHMAEAEALSVRRDTEHAQLSAACRLHAEALYGQAA